MPLHVYGLSIVVPLVHPNFILDTCYSGVILCPDLLYIPRMHLCFGDEFCAMDDESTLTLTRAWKLTLNLKCRPARNT